MSLAAVGLEVDDATDDPLHGDQEGRFFHGYDRCYCYLPLYIFCGRHLLVAKLRRANNDAAAEGAPARRFKDFMWSTRKSWSQQRRVVAKAEWTRGEANPRFVVTNLSAEDIDARPL